MKHGVAFRKFSRTSSHRMLMLRNLVTSLFEHEQIKTTLPKARDTARLAEKMITLGKRNDRSSYFRAAAFLLKPALLHKLFSTFTKRYADRPGGYTRIHKFGNRPGDNAPHAILELVDNPRDLRWEITSRAIGREVLRDKLQNQKPLFITNRNAKETRDLIESERSLGFKSSDGLLRPKTRWNLQKVLGFRDRNASVVLSRKVEDYMDHLLATPVALREIHDLKTKNPRNSAPRLKAGETIPGETRGALQMARGQLSERKPASKLPLLSAKNVFGFKPKTL